MFLDDAPPKKKDAPEPRNLERLSLSELEEYIVWLDGEIKRVREDIARKSNQNQLAENLFKKNPSA
jgi:uncharacterized small protein (DUF1192 family)